MKKKHKVVLSVIVILILILGLAALISVNHFIGVPKAVGDTEYEYKMQEMSAEYDGIELYGQALIPDGEGVFPTVIYAHGAESDYKSDMTTLKSLAMSGIACYTFDFYGWTDRSTGR